MNESAGVTWRYAPRGGWIAAVDIVGADWLSAAELRECARWRDARRREQWRVARAVAKTMLLHACPSSAPRPRDVEILSRTAAGGATRPQVALLGRAFRGSLSLAHTERGVLVALTEQPGVRLGADLASVRRWSRGFLELWFTRRERSELRAVDAWRAARLWAGKEAAYKALNQGERFSPRRWEVHRGEGGWLCRHTESSPTRVARLCLFELDGQAVALAVSADEETTSGCVGLSAGDLGCPRSAR